MDKRVEAAARAMVATADWSSFWTLDEARLLARTALAAADAVEPETDGTAGPRACTCGGIEDSLKHGTPHATHLSSCPMNEQPDDTDGTGTFDVEDEREWPDDTAGLVVRLRDARDRVVDSVMHRKGGALMSIPANKERDVDILLDEAAAEIERLTYERDQARARVDELETGMDMEDKQ